MQVLVVEDNKPIQMLICRVIEGMSHTVIAANSGEEALLKYHEADIDLVLMDVEMPGINGFETTRRLRKIGGDQWIPIIFLSANSDEEHLAKGIDAGGDDYLVKPVKPVVLRAKIKAMERIALMRADLSHSNQELERLNVELERLSYLDGLTGVLNRRAFDKRFNQEWKLFNRENRPLCVVLIDIDHFKNYNDHYGHLAGDDCLRTVAEALSETVRRPVDLIARYGGEEFVALLPNTDVLGGYNVALALLGAVADKNIEHAATTVPSGKVSVSIGLNCIETADPMGSEQFLKYADEALYQAKTNGRNRVEVYNVKDPDTLLATCSDSTAVITDLTPRLNSK